MGVCGVFVDRRRDERMKSRSVASFTFFSLGNKYSVGFVNLN